MPRACAVKYKDRLSSILAPALRGQQGPLQEYGPRFVSISGACSSDGGDGGPQYARGQYIYVIYTQIILQIPIRFYIKLAM